MKNQIVFSVAVTALGLALGCSRAETPGYSSVTSTNSSTRAGITDTNNYSTPPAVIHTTSGVTATLTNGDVGVSSLSEPVLPAGGFASASPSAQMQRIHDSLLADASLAPLANTVHVSKTSDGHVVLAGSVTTLTEKQRVSAIAEAVVGAGKVDNQLAIK